MAKGGSRSRSGPAPDPTALRRDRPSDKASWTHLPSSGRAGDPPGWPLSAASPRERRLWADEWRRPQALSWEANGQQIVVALYVRAVVVAESRKATATDRTVVIRYLDDLGISNAGLARNRWVIDGDTGNQAEVSPDLPSTGRSAKERALRLVVNE